jgi:hypothetical protein
VTGNKPIVVSSLSISGMSAVNPLAVFYDIHGRKGEVLFLSSVTNTIRHENVNQITRLGFLFYVTEEKTVSVFL